MIRLYGHYASQPCWSVFWLLQIQGVPYEFIKIDPSSTDTTSKPMEFISKFPLGLIPAMIDISGDNDVKEEKPKEFCLSEASAIMIYLCEKYGWNDWYPCSSPSTQTMPRMENADLQRKARIHEYISHHNESSRMLTRKVFRPAWMAYLSPNLALRRNFKNWDERQAYQVMQQQGQSFQNAFLKMRSTCTANDENDGSTTSTTSITTNSSSGQYCYIGGYQDKPSIADLLAYPEFAQITYLLGMEYSKHNLSQLYQWFEGMKCIDYHDDLTRTVSKLGRLVQREKQKKQEGKSPVKNHHLSHRPVGSKL